MIKVQNNVAPDIMKNNFEIKEPYCNCFSESS